MAYRILQKPSLSALSIQLIGDFFFSFFLFPFLCFLGLQLQHMEVPRLGVKSELQLFTTATTTPDALELQL